MSGEGVRQAHWGEDLGISKHDLVSEDQHSSLSFPTW